MAFSGSGGGYYYTSVYSNTGINLHQHDTIHCFYKSSIASGGGSARGFAGWRGSGIPTNNPDEYLFWGHPVTAFSKSRGHREAGGGYVSAQMTSSPASDTWHSICSTFDGTNARLYVNGVLEATSIGSDAGGVNDIRASLLAIAIGADGSLDGGQCIDGEVAEFAIWGVPLDASNTDEIVSLAKGFRAKMIRPQSLLMYVPCVRGRQEIHQGGTVTLTNGSEVISEHPRVYG